MIIELLLVLKMLLLSIIIIILWLFYSKYSLNLIVKQ